MTEIRSFGDLIDRHEGRVTVACDTEFNGPHTLTVQFAARLGDDVVVQVYSSPAVSAQPDPEELARLLPPGILPPGQRLIVREGLPISNDLSPARVLADLFGLRGVEVSDRLLDEPPEVDGELTLTLVAHFWPADFFRVFGRRFFGSLLDYQVLGGPLTVTGHKLLAFKEGSGRRPPILGYAGHTNSLYAVRVKYFDTQLAFGRGSLDDHARTFLGVGKLEGFGERQKADMLGTFRDQPCRAYAYAITDAVLTLRVHERMGETNADMYRQLGFAAEDVPALRSTHGSRVAEMMARSVARAAAGSATLSHRGKVSQGKVKALLEKGAGGYIAEERLSNFGKQTGQTHGGLLFSRSPTRLFHAAPGMFRDVDLSGCYAGAMRDMCLYAGRPVIHEPGTRGMTLRDAVRFAERHAAGCDAWFAKVSGKITAWPNALIPSTLSALTNDNHRRRAARRRAAGRYGFPFDRAAEARRGTGNTAIFTDVVEGGVVARATWLIIQALPREWREEYERLEVDTLVFYPKQFVADDAPAFDALVERHTGEGTPWRATIDMEELVQTITWRFDEEHVSLRFDLGGLVGAMQDRREAAKREHGKGSAADRAWKEQVNSLYGVTASPHLPTNNIVAANVITATARALAFAMQLSLNGVQVITDGCTYRKDQVPAGTLARCLAACPDYPINREGFAGPFLNPADVPDGSDLTAWYRGHVKRFLGVSGPDYDRLFGLHGLEHKECGPGGVSFDGLCCDGSSYYVKLVQSGRDWRETDLKDGFKARSYKQEAKKALVEPLVRAYSTDSYAGPPPATESSGLLTNKDAGRVARKAFKRYTVTLAGLQPGELYYPLGLDLREVQAYKMIKSSAFLFRTPKQRAAWARAMGKFAKATSCGLELLALRKSGGGRQQGSISDVARLVYELVRAGEMNPTKALNLNRPFAARDEVEAHHHAGIGLRKLVISFEMARQIDPARMEPAARLTGLFVRRDHIQRIAPPT